MRIGSFAKKMSVLAVLAGSCFAASATTTILGPVTTGIPKDFAGLAANGSINDIFSFTLPVSGGSGYSATNFTLLPGLYNTILATMTLLSDPNGSVAAGLGLSGDEQILASSVVPGGQLLQLHYGPSASGNMLLNITGLATGTSGGIYTGAISASAVTPVPEPESYAMLLAGLGVMGAIAMRRNRSKSD